MKFKQLKIKLKAFDNNDNIIATAKITSGWYINISSCITDTVIEPNNTTIYLSNGFCNEKIQCL